MNHEEKKTWLANLKAGDTVIISGRGTDLKTLERGATAFLSTLKH